MIGTEPIFIEEDVFKTIIPLYEQTTNQTTNQTGDQATNQTDGNRRLA